MTHLYRRHIKGEAEERIISTTLENAHMYRRTEIKIILLINTNKITKAKIIYSLIGKEQLTHITASEN